MPRGISQKTKEKQGPDRNPPKGPKRTPDEVCRDRADIARLRLEGLTQAQIAAKISSVRDYSLSHQMVSVDMKSVREQWLTTSTDDYEKTRLIELSRLDEEESIVKAAWERSILPRVRSEEGTLGDKGFDKTITENRDGNPAFLARLESIRLRRCRILGFEAHQRSENINAAIDTLLAAGYVVRLPEVENAESQA